MPQSYQIKPRPTHKAARTLEHVTIAPSTGLLQSQEFLPASPALLQAGLRLRATEGSHLEWDWRKPS